MGKFKNYIAIGLLLASHLIHVADVALVAKSKHGLVQQDQSINDLLLDAVVARRVDKVKKYIKLGATNLDVALELARDLEKDQVAVEIITLLKKALSLKSTSMLNVAAHGFAISCAGIVLAQTISYLHDKYVEATDPQRALYVQELAQLLHMKERGEADYKGQRTHHDAVEVYDEYKVQVAGLVNSGIHPHSDKDKAKVARIFMSLKQEDDLEKYETYKDILAKEKIHYSRTEGLFKQRLQAKDKAGLTPTEEICLKYMEAKPGLLYAWVTRLDAHKHAQAHNGSSAEETMFHDFVRVMEGVADNEREVISQGYVPFSHGRRWEFGFLKDVYNFVEAVEQNRSDMSDEIKMRYRGNDCDRKQFEQWRKDLVVYGAHNHSESSTQGSGKDTEITYLARTPLSNASLVGENPLRLFLTNFSYARKPVALSLAKKLLQERNLIKFEHEVEKLFAVHESANTKEFGELLTVGIKPEEVDDIIYVSLPRGYKYRGFRSDKTSENIKYCQHDIKAHDDSLDTDGDFCNHKHSYDARMFCAACLTLPGEYGKKYIIKNTHLADSEKLQKVRQGFEELLRQAKS